MQEVTRLFTCAKLCQFFTAIGQRKHGDRLKPRWNEVKGAEGFAVVGVRSFKGDKGDDIEVNEIKEFLTPEEGKARFNAAESKTESNDELKF
jgi:hypothetical protein